jgi:MFS family permease
MKKPNKQELVYFLVKFFNQYYLMGIWVLFYLKFTDYKGIGIIEAVQIIVMFLSEIPTGIFADRFGRKKSELLD